MFLYISYNINYYYYYIFVMYYLKKWIDILFMTLVTIMYYILIMILVKVIGPNNIIVY